MKTTTVTKARSQFDKLLDETAKSHEPVQITGKRSSGILVSEGDWRAIQETMHMLSIPGLRESIRTGLDTPLDET